MHWWTFDMSHLMTKPTKWHVCPTKTQISLGILPAWPESSLCAQWVAKDSSYLHADSEDSDQTGRMPRLMWVFAGRTCHFVGFVMRRLIFRKHWQGKCLPRLGKGLPCGCISNEPIQWYRENALQTRKGIADLLIYQTWGFISRNYVVWPIFFLMNVFIALQGTHFWFLFAFTAAGVVQCGGRKKSLCKSTIVQFIFYFGPLRSAWIFWEIRNKWLVYSRQVFNYLDLILIYISLWIDCLFEIRKIAICFLWLSLPGHWWGFISRDYVEWPIFFLMNVFIAVKGTFFYFDFYMQYCRPQYTTISYLLPGQQSNLSPRVAVDDLMYCYLRSQANWRATVHQVVHSTEGVVIIETKNPQKIRITPGTSPLRTVGSINYRGFKALLLSKHVHPGPRCNS